MYCFQSLYLGFRIEYRNKSHNVLHSVLKPTNINGQEVNTVNARDLYEFRVVGRDFSTWIKERIDQFSFVEGIDFVISPKSGEYRKPLTEYHLAPNMAKEIGMVAPIRAKNQSIDSHALPVAVRRNLAWPLTDKNGKPLYQKDGKPASENRLKVDQFTPHDLRRTAATFMSSLGFMDEIIDAVLNHVKQGIIRTYNLNK